MSVDPSEIENILILLTQTPERIARVCMRQSSERLALKPEGEDWSVNDILAHLRSCSDVWGKSIQIMIAQDHPTLRYISPRTWIKKKNYSSLEFRTSLESFTQQRNELLLALKALAFDDWSRGATFTGTTKDREPTILSYAQRIVAHEVEHCLQIESLLEPD